VVPGFEQMTSYSEQVLNSAVHRKKALRLSDRLEATQFAFLLAGWLVGDFGPIVLVSTRLVHYGRKDLTMGG
jgi:hypothetical protein